MLERNKPIVSRPSGAPTTPQSQLPKPKPPASGVAKVVHKHDDQWLMDHKGQSVSVTFTDGEELEGKLSMVCKFTFTLESETTSILVHKLAIKHVTATKRVL